MASITSGELQTLRAEFAGAVITPADPAYAAACAAGCGTATSGAAPP